MYVYCKKLICYSAFADNGLTSKMIPNHDSKFRDLYLIKSSYINCTQNIWERSGSVVECLTRDKEAAGSSLTGVTALWSLSETHLS